MGLQPNFPGCYSAYKSYKTSSGCFFGALCEPRNVSGHFCEEVIA